MLDFDVLVLNSSQLGLLNGSRIELQSLSDLQLSCVKLDQYGLNDDTNEIVDTDMSEELTVETKVQIIQNKLRLRVHVSVPVVSDHSFGEYVCLTYCMLQTKSNNNTRIGCVLKKTFSIVPRDWISDMQCRQEHRYFKQCVEDKKHVEETWRKVFLDVVEIMLNENKYYLMTYKNMTDNYLQANIESDFWKTVLAVILLLSSASLTYKFITYRRQQQRIANSLKQFAALESVSQSTENTEDRNMT